MLNVGGSKSHMNDSANGESSEESVSSDKLPQDRWEDNECDKFRDKWVELNREINELEKRKAGQPSHNMNQQALLESQLAHKV